MSYLVLARKWRPKTFAEMVGQEHVLRALINALDDGRLHHAFLFAGTRGVGKTTLARILAKCLNCEQGVSSTPCGKCDSCVEIDEGRFVDLIEVDAASRTKVDDTRELLENVQYAPTRGRFKVYLIDEVHMLSTHSFNALLKTLEEPPPHVKFLLATTDAQKLPVTVLSRCLQFNLKRLPPDLIQGRLAEIMTAEKVSFEPIALELLARAADGSMRDGLSLLDQAISFCAGAVREADVRQMLGTLDTKHVVGVLDSLAEGDAADLLRRVAELDEQAPDYVGVLDEIIRLLQRIALVQVVPNGDDREQGAHKQVLALSEKLSPEDVQLFYQIALIGRRDLPLVPDLRSGFEMVMLRMLAFRPATLDEETLRSEPQPRRSASKRQKKEAKRPALAKTSSDIDWRQLIAAAELSGAARQLAENCVLVQRENDVFHLQLDNAHEHLLTTQQRQFLERALSAYMSSPVKLRIDVGEPMTETPAKTAQRVSEERLDAARAALEQDPNVQALKETFGASIQPESIKPVDEHSKEEAG